MSVQAMSWALTQQVITNATARHVLLCLANYADQDGKSAFPSVATLKHDTGLSERTIRAKLADLQQAGVIVEGNQKVVAAYIDRGDRRPICYDIVLKRGASDAGRNERGENGAATGCSSRTNGVQMTHERGAGAAPDPSSKPPYKPSVNPKDKDSHESGLPNVQTETPMTKTKKPRGQYSTEGLDFSNWPEQPSEQVLTDWVIVRKENKAPLTQTAITRMGNQLQRAFDAGYSVDQCLSMAIDRGWRGFDAEWIINASLIKPVRSAKSGALREGTQGINYHEGVSDDGRF